METGHGKQESSWLGTIIDYAMLSSGYPTILRYISGFFTLLGCLLVFPAVFLILLDIALWVGRTFWNSVVRRDGSPDQPATAAAGGPKADSRPKIAVDDAHASAVQPADGSQAVRRHETQIRSEGNDPLAVD